MNSEAADAMTARAHGPAWWAGAAGVLLLFLAVTVQKIWSADTWWQLSVGRWIVQHRAVTTVDEFSFTAAGNPEIEMRWVWCVLLYLGWQIGPWLLVLGQAALLAGAWGTIVVATRRALTSPVSLLVIALGLAAGQNRWVMRPELMTYLLLAAYLVLLDRAAQRRRAGAAWAIPALQVLWTNSHTLFVLGPILCFTFTGGDALGRLIRREAPIARAINWKLVAVAVLTVLACLVNPYGVRGALFTLEIYSQSSAGSIVAQSIGEMQSPLAIPIQNWTWDLWSGVALALLGAATFVRPLRTIDPARLAVFLGGLYLATKAQRGLGMFALMGGWAALRNLEDGGAAVVLRATVDKVRVPLLGAVALLSAGAAWYVATDRSFIRVSAPRETGLGVVRWNTPDSAAQFLLETGAPGPVFNQIRDGGYLIWRAGERIKVFVDGRTDVYGEQFLRELDSLSAATWPALADKWKINTAVISVRGYTNLVASIASDPAWVLVHLDHRNVIFARNTPGNAGLIARYRIDPAQPWVPRGPEPDQRPERWKAAIGGPGRPWFTQGMAAAFMAVGSIGNAGTYLERTLSQYPAHQGARADLAAIRRYQGRGEEGDRLAEGLPRDWQAYSDDMLARWLVQAGRHQEAIPVLERLVALPDTALSVRVVLADEYFQAGDFESAKTHYERAIAAGHDAAPEWLKLAGACERTNDRAGAIRAYRRSLELEPSNYQGWNALGKHLGSAGDLRGAANCFQRALQVKPDFEPARRNLEAVQAAMQQR